MRHIFLSAIAVLFLSPAALLASDYPIDLATHSGNQSMSVPVGPLRPVVLHRLPTRNYSVIAVLETMAPPPLTLPDRVNIAGTASGGNACAALQLEYDKVTAIAPTDEAQGAQVGEKLAALLQGEAGKACTGPVKDEVTTAVARYDNALPLAEYVMKAGETLRIIVNRLKADGSVEKTWTTVLTTGAKGEWLTTFGMAFLPKRDDVYFAKAGTEANKFTITRQRDGTDNGLKFLPSVLFSWMPAKARNQALVLSPTAGFGATSTGFGALGGVTLTYNVNLGVTFGIAVTPQKRLAGKYTEGQVVTENLSDTQLHESILRQSGFVAITFRFGSNPFKEAGSTPATTAGAGSAPAKASGS